MPNSSPRQAANSAANRFTLSIAICLIWACATVDRPTLAQTLARPGWVGSGLNTDPWWKTAIFFNIRSLGGEYPDFKAITARLDAIQALGVDAVVVPMPHLPEQPFPPSPGSVSPTVAAAPPLVPGIDEFDDLVHEASRRNLRVLLNIAPYDPSSPAFDLNAAGRFWLTHGIAGFRLVAPVVATPEEGQTMLQELRRLTNAALGQRIVIAAYDASQPSFVAIATPSGRRGGTASRPISAAVDTDHPQLQVDSRLGKGETNAVTIRPLILQTSGQPNLLLAYGKPSSQPLGLTPSDKDHPLAAASSGPSVAKVIATILLTTHTAGMIDAEQVPGLRSTALPVIADAAGSNPAATMKQGSSPARLTVQPRSLSVASWIHDLIALHHDNAGLRVGNNAFLDFDNQDALVWVARPSQEGKGQFSPLNPPMVIACNLSAKPVMLSLTSALSGLNLRGTFLRTILRSDDALGPQDLNAVSLPPYGVYIGELKR
jgi:hypothetical protein